MAVVVLVAITGLLISLLVFSLLRDAEHKNLQENFEELAVAHQVLFKARLSYYTEELETIRRFFASSNSVERHEFNTFVRPMLGRHPGIEMIGWAPRVTDAQRAEYERQTRQEGIPEYAIRSSESPAQPESSRAVYFPLQFVESKSGFRSTIGIDLASVSAYEEDLRSANGDGHFRLLPTDALLPDQKDLFLIVLPVYYAQQDKGPSGYLLAAFNIISSFESAVYGLPRHGISIDITNARSGHVLYHRHNPDIDPHGYTDHPVGHHVLPLDVGGQVWEMHFVATPDYLKTHDQWQALIVLVMGLMLSAVAVVFVVSSRRNTAVVTALVETRTEQLRESELRHRTVLETMADGLVTIDDQGIVRSFNPAAERIFGYRASEVIGQNVAFIMPEPYRQEHDAYLQRYLATGEARVIGVGREVHGLRKDGSVFHAYLALGEMRINGKRMFSGIIRDISDRIQAERELSRFKTTLDMTLDCVFMFNPETLRFFYVNQGAIAQVGYSEDELMQMRAVDLMPEFDEARFHKVLRSLIEGKRDSINFETVQRHKNGHTMAVEIFLQYIAPTGESPRFVAIVRDISERKNVERMKDEFISTVSHELRTPLTSIRGSLGLLTGGAVGELPAQIRSLLDIAHKNTERLLLLINDILDINKIELGQMPFRFDNLKVMPFVEQAVIANSAYGEQYGVRFEVVQSVDDAWVLGDSDRLMQVMSNLMSNAAKFSPLNGVVEIAVVRHKGVVRISVTDHGPGIPESFQPKVFEKFTQSDSSDTRQVGGSGLGLNISRAIVERHGGRIDFVSSEGLGTTFYFELPSVSVIDGRDAAREPLRIDADEGSSVLIVEDDPDVAVLLRMMLTESGFNADIARSAEEAKEMLATQNYKAMTLDLMLPGQDGLELVKELRSSPETEDLPVVVVSATADIARRRLDGGAVGIEDWIGKPFDKEHLLSAVTRAIESHHDPRILHVEDDPDVVNVVKRLLQPYADVVPASSLSDAKALLHHQHFDLVLLDIALPDGTGMALIEELKNSAPPVPVIIFSAYEVDDGIEAQVESALLKSSTSNARLIDVITSYLAMIDSKHED